MLIAKNLSKEFIVKSRKNIFSKSITKIITAVKDVSLQIEKGKIVGLLGINGAGKSTTIKMLSTMLEPTSGSLTIDGIDGIKEYKSIKNKLNIIVGGEKNLYWRLTAKENLEYFGALYNIDKKVLQERISNLIKLVGLEDAQDTPVERYSKGMKQRLQIARGLINDPNYIFLDEPTLGLDIAFAKEVRAYIKKLASIENKGLLLTTHYISEVEELCDYIYIIDKGEIILEGTKEQIKETIKTHHELVIRTTSNIQEAISILTSNNKDLIIKEDDSTKGIFKVISKEDRTSEIVKQLSDNQISINEIKMVESSLEDAMIGLLKGDRQNENVKECSNG